MYIDHIIRRVSILVHKYGRLKINHQSTWQAFCAVIFVSLHRRHWTMVMKLVNLPLPREFPRWREHTIRGNSDDVLVIPPQASILITTGDYFWCWFPRIFYINIVNSSWTRTFANLTFPNQREKADVTSTAEAFVFKRLGSNFCDLCRVSETALVRSDPAWWGQRH